MSIDNTTAPENPFRFALPEDQDQRDRLAELGSIAGGLVHELKNPIGAIALNVDMLLHACSQDNLEPEKSERRLRRIQAGVEQLQQVAQGFLAFARPGRPDLNRIDVNDLLEDILEEQRELLEEQHITITTHLAEDLAAVPGDRMQLRAVFLNIILNARDALMDNDEDERKLVIATRNRSQGPRIVIANNGPPLNDNAAAHLFDPFYSGKDGGTGLGLAIVARLVALHHGKVTASSDPAQGVSFTIEIPSTLGPAKARTELPAPDAGLA